MGGAYLGVDVGSTYCKAVVLNEKKELTGFHMVRTGISFEQAAEVAATTSLSMAGQTTADVAACISTGYGRENVPFRNSTVSEISCHSKAAFEKYQSKVMLVDIGGQDNKVIQLDDKGKRINFTMNRKCAAGTGAFLEEMALRMGIRIDDMDRYARGADKIVELGSFCTVFAGTEILGKIREGETVSNLVKGVFYSIIKRISAMAKLEGRVVITGGVAANNPYLVEMMREMAGCEILLPTHPQLFGAIGAALYALDSNGRSMENAQGV